MLSICSIGMHVCMYIYIYKYMTGTQEHSVLPGVKTATFIMYMHT
jgi:hypothetical protein